MNQIVNQPDYSFVVVSKLPDGRLFEVFKIDQCLPMPKRNRQKDGIANQMAQHFNDLHLKTGLSYLVIYEGNPEMAEAVLKEHQECPF